MKSSFEVPVEATPEWFLRQANLTVDKAEAGTLPVQVASDWLIDLMGMARRRMEQTTGSPAGELTWKTVWSTIDGLVFKVLKFQSTFDSPQEIDSAEGVIQYLSLIMQRFKSGRITDDLASQSVDVAAGLARNLGVLGQTQSLINAVKTAIVDRHIGFSDPEAYIAHLNTLIQGAKAVSTPDGSSFQTGGSIGPTPHILQEIKVIIEEIGRIITPSEALRLLGELMGIVRVTDDIDEVMEAQRVVGDLVKRQQRFDDGRYQGFDNIPPNETVRFLGGAAVLFGEDDDDLDLDVLDIDWDSIDDEEFSTDNAEFARVITSSGKGVRTIPDNEKFVAILRTPTGRSIAQFIRAKSASDAMKAARKWESSAKGNLPGSKLVMVRGVSGGVIFKLSGVKIAPSALISRATGVPGGKGPPVLIGGKGQVLRSPGIRPKGKGLGKAGLIGLGIGAGAAAIKALRGKEDEPKRKRGFEEDDNHSDFESHTLTKVPIFTAGSHTDSMGRGKTFSKEDLAAIVTAFKAGAPPEVPLKMGHSSDEFNAKVATALGLPKLLISGEGDNHKGQVRLGSVKALHMNGSLTADLDVPEQVGKLIKDGLLTGVSAELQFDRRQGDKTHPIVLSGLALLGAQRPALSDLPSLQSATMLEDGSHADAVFFSDLDAANYATLAEEKAELKRELDRERIEGAKELIRARTVSKLKILEAQRTGSRTVPGAESGEPGSNPFTVPFQRGANRVTVGVSAASEITAKKTALKVLENFGLSATGPLGAIVGTAGAGVLTAKLVTGKPKLGGTVGKLQWNLTRKFLGLLGRAALKGFEDAAIEESTFSIMEKIIRFFSPLQAVGDLAGVRDEIKSTLVQINNGDITQAQGMGQIRQILQDVRGLSPDDTSQVLKIIDSELRRGGAASKVKSQENSEMDITTLATALNLAEDATEEQILTRVDELLVSEEESKKFEEGQQKRLEFLEHQHRVSVYGEATAQLTHTPGDSKAKAEQLAALEEKAGKATAEEVLKTWQESDKFAETAGVTVALLNAHSGNSDEETFDSVVAKYQEEHPDATIGDATKAVMASHRSLYLAQREYHNTPLTG